ncbi:hypothetical protein BpHYR1_053402 [Brachionus plicatilis]|uniref:Uncharacterized protein n=1 Tax=Brachionus plicatilis TaxID=10195 RepID=A0A3M7QX09_BRAPC|nr:hypothetical protein BpHYR1_053402 [Brachionus plicatilis]
MIYSTSSKIQIFLQLGLTGVRSKIIIRIEWHVFKIEYSILLTRCYNISSLCWMNYYGLELIAKMEATSVNNSLTAVSSLDFLCLYSLI